jgi:hypothetical protein
MKTLIGAIAGALAVGSVLFAYELGGSRALDRAATTPATQMMMGPDGVARPYLVSSQTPYAAGAYATLPGWSPSAQAVPAVSYPTAQPQVRYVNDRVATEEPVVRRVSTRQRSAEPVAPKRTWQKSAILIGGSAAGGAGIGGLVGGKKGALAGAAIAGGAAAIYDQVKRR